MIRCQSCGNKNSDTAQYCDECGTKLAGEDIAGSMVSVVSEPVSHGNIPDFSVHSTSSGVPAIVERLENEESRLPENRAEHASGRHAILYIERGDAAATEFSMAGMNPISVVGTPTMEFSRTSTSMPMIRMQRFPGGMLV